MTAAPLVGLALLFASLLAEGQAKREARSSPAEAAVPFRVGEKLEYRVGWANFLTAATLRLAVAERRRFFGREAWHFQAFARTVEPVRFLYALDDQFDSYTDTATLSSLRYEMHLREQGGQEDSVVRMSTGQEPAQSDGPTVRVLPGTRDPLAVLYFLRAVDWQRTKETSTPVYDGKKLYELRARVERDHDEVSVPAGTYPAWKIELRVYDRGRELAETRFWLWLTRNTPRCPALIEAELPFGSVRVELNRAGQLP